MKNFLFYLKLKQAVRHKWFVEQLEYPRVTRFFIPIDVLFMGDYCWINLSNKPHDTIIIYLSNLKIYPNCKDKAEVLIYKYKKENKHHGRA